MIASLFLFALISMLLKIQYFEEIIYNYIQYFEEIIYMRLYEGIKFCTFSGNLFDD